MHKKSIICSFMLILFPLLITAQNKFELKGKVFDTSGSPLAGVNVSIKGTTTATISDFDGNFNIKGRKDGDVLTVSYIGFVAQEIQIKGQQTLRITLEEDSKNLSEVMVVAYGTQKKATLTGAISSIGSTELLKSPSASVSNILAGALTGVSSVQYSGKPGGDDAQLFIRGVGGLTEGASAPLILVDGVERSFTQMDPQEIENLTVLKDASATAVFGVRGANGVILITTKRGVEGKAKINVTSSYGMQTPTRVLNNTNGYDYATAVNEVYKNDGFGDNYMIKPNIMEMFKNKSQPIMFPDVNWREVLMKNETQQTQHSLTISGGTKSVRYFTSVGYLFQDGLFRKLASTYNNNFDFNRFNYRTNIDIDVTKTTTFKLNIGGRVEKRNEPNGADSWAGINSAAPISSPGVIDGKYIARDDYYFPLSLKDGLEPWYGRGFINKTKNVLNIDLSFNQKLDFVTKGLSVDAKASYNGNFDYNKTRSTSIQKYIPYFKCNVDPTSPNDSTVVYRITGENAELGYGETYDKARDWYMEGAIRYKRDFGKHHVSGLLLYNQSKTYYPASYTDIASGYVGLVGRATYDYNNCYLLEVNMGYNGSENFAPGKTRYGLFPSFSGGWVISEEPFMKSQRIFDQLKIRGSYGTVGNDKGIQRFLYIPDVYTIGSVGYSFGTTIPENLKGADEGKMGNPIITWETAAKQNYGIDMILLNQKLTINADLFMEDRKNILINRTTTPGFVAANLPAVNMGRVKNWGYELSLKWEQRINDFRYFISPNVTFSRNKIMFMDETPPNEPYLARTGHPVGTPFGRVFYDFYKADVTNEDGSITKMTYP
ncbi:MAG: SusC/RagA family TonB-linked outer membrane protein, partial [Bacteroidia bacterium]|nr:SusC/RagA family TonB-linked outer membrane protein [Bacteroidia bacterium]